jgi:hypothetical protein
VTTAFAYSSHLEQNSSNEVAVEILLDHYRTNSELLSTSLSGFGRFSLVLGSLPLLLVQPFKVTNGSGLMIWEGVLPLEDDVFDENRNDISERGGGMMKGFCDAVSGEAGVVGGLAPRWLKDWF